MIVKFLLDGKDYSGLAEDFGMLQAVKFSVQSKVKLQDHSVKG